MKLDPEQLKAIEHTGSQKTSSILRCERVTFFKTHTIPTILLIKFSIVNNF